MTLIEKMLKNGYDKSPRYLFESTYSNGEPYGDLLESFKLRHAKLKENPTHRANLNHTMLGALNLDLWPLAEKYAETIQIRYSATPAIYNILFYHYFRKNVDSANELIQYIIDQGSPRTRRRES